MRIDKIGNNLHRLDVFVKINGKQYRKRETFQGTERQAKDRWYDIRNELKEQAKHEEQAVLERTGTFKYILDEYKKDRKRMGKMITMHSIFDRLIADCGNYKYDQIGARFLQYIDILNSRKSERKDKKLSNATKNRFISVAKAACNWAYRQDILKSDPLKSIQLFKEKPRDRILTETEVLNLRNDIIANYDYLLPAFDFSLKNPIAISDIRALTKDNLDLFNNLILYTRKKTNTQAAAIIYPEMVEYFRSIPNDCPYLFYRVTGGTKRNPVIKYHSIGDFKKAWIKIKQNAHISVDSLHWHDLRHCACTWLAHQPGIKTHHIQKIGAWKSRSMVDRYHNTEAETAATEARELLLRQSPLESPFNGKKRSETDSQETGTD